MKKRVKKLVLAKETVGSIETSRLDRMAGGSLDPRFGCGGTGASIEVPCVEGILTERDC